MLHDDRESVYILSSDEGGVWRDTPLRAPQLASLSLGGQATCYVTHNGFSGKRRRLEGCRQVNAMFFDLDCHEASQFTCRRLVAEAQRLLDAAVAEGDLPEPTMVVDSGRGLHLYYVLERSIPCRVAEDGRSRVNERSLGYFRDVQLRLADALGELLAGLDGIGVDRAVFDLPRVSRVPGTYNAKAGRFAHLTASDGPFWHLGDLAAYRPAKQPQGAPEAPQAPSPSVSKVVRFDRLMMARLKNVSDLQEYRGFACEGRRELMCFVYYNTAAQIYGRAEAGRLLEAFNARFNSPLDSKELGGILSSVDGVVNLKKEKGHYILTAETLVDMLGLTQEEIEAVGFFSSKRRAERAEAKRRTRERRGERDRRICELYEGGTMTQQQVADEVGCSLKTVYRVLKAAGLTRSQEPGEPEVAAAGAESVLAEVLGRRAREENRTFFGNRVFGVVKGDGGSAPIRCSVPCPRPAFHARSNLAACAVGGARPPPERSACPSGRRVRLHQRI
ncbi:MAG: helix-turn-helix domain-containing protein [Coriobacteriales bacterium]